MPCDVDPPELQALESNGHAVIRLRHDFVVIAWSRGASRLFGWTAEEAVGRRVSELINLAGTAAEQAKVEKLRRELLETGELRHTDTWYAKDRTVLVEAHLSATPDGFLGVMQGRQVRLDTERPPKLRQINLRLPEDLIEAIEAARGDMPRERFLRMVITSYLESADDREIVDHPTGNV